MKHISDIQVVYIITKLELGGAQKVCLELLHGLEQEQATALLISSTQGILVEKVKDKPNVVLLNSLNRDVSMKGLWQELKCFYELTTQLKKLKKQYPNLIVHTHSTKAGLWGRWSAFFAGVKKRIHTVHGYAFHDHQSKPIWFAIYLCELFTSFITSHFVCVSSEDVKTGIRLFPRFAKKHSIIRAAVDTKQFFVPAQKATNSHSFGQPFIFGTVACFKPQKNLFDLLHAFKSVHSQNPNTKLEIIGDGALRGDIEKWIEDNALADHIILHGWQNQVAPIMLEWNSFVLSSLWEGLPCAIVEARLLKLPVLCYNTGGIHDVITHGENGYLYKRGNWQDLAQGMLTISIDKNLYTSLQSYPDDLQDFDLPQMIKEHIELYKRITK